MKKFRKKLMLPAALALLLHIWCCAQFHMEDWEVASARVPAAVEQAPSAHHRFKKC